MWIAIVCPSTTNINQHQHQRRQTTHNDPNEPNEATMTTVTMTRTDRSNHMRNRRIPSLCVVALSSVLLLIIIISSNVVPTHGFTANRLSPVHGMASTSRQGRLERSVVHAMNDPNSKGSDIGMDDGPIWSPDLRKIMAGTASLGAIETLYLALNKGSEDICGLSGNCGSVLNGPYATIPHTDIPLSAFGCVAYTLTALLAIAPVLVNEKDNDSLNRVALLTVTTSMATFSTFLMSLLFGVLQTSCPFCLASATFSWTLAACAWLGGCLPPQQERKVMGLQSSAYGFLGSVAAAVALFVSVDTNPVYASGDEALPPQSPPPITTVSTSRALAIANDLQQLDATMYGAFWCSHCYDQKQALGQQAFAKVKYVECSKDGVNSNTKLCKDKEVPGYPTWEIAGKLYPGEQELVELEDIIREAK